MLRCVKQISVLAWFLLSCQDSLLVKKAPPRAKEAPVTAELAWSADEKTSAATHCQESLVGTAYPLEPICACLVEVAAATVEYSQFAKNILDYYDVTSVLYADCYAKARIPAALTGHEWDEPLIIEPLDGVGFYTQILKDGLGNASLFFEEDGRGVLWEKRFLHNVWLKPMIASTQSTGSFTVAVNEENEKAAIGNASPGASVMFSDRGIWREPKIATDVASYTYTASATSNEGRLTAIHATEDFDANFVLRYSSAIVRVGLDQSVVATPFGTDEAVARRAQVFFDTAGREHIVYQMKTDAGISIRHCLGHKSADCSESAEIGLAAAIPVEFSNGSEIQFRAAANKRGDMQVAWWDRSGVSARYYDSRQDAWRDFHKIQDLTTNSHHLELCVDNTGSGFVFWSQDPEIRFTRFVEGVTWESIATITASADLPLPVVSAQLKIDCNNHGLVMIVAGHPAAQGVFFYNGKELVRDLISTEQPLPFLGDFGGGFLYYQRVDGPNFNAWARHFRFTNP